MIKFSGFQTSTAFHMSQLDRLPPSVSNGSNAPHVAPLQVESRGRSRSSWSHRHVNMVNALERFQKACIDNDYHVVCLAAPTGFVTNPRGKGRVLCCARGGGNALLASEGFMVATMHSLIVSYPYWPVTERLHLVHCVAGSR